MKMLRVIAAVWLLIAPALADEQASYVWPTGTVPGPAGSNSLGSLTANFYNPALRALATCSAGSVAPANGPSNAPLPYQCWMDTSASPTIYLRYWDGAQWPALATLDASSHAWVFSSASLVRSVFGTADTIQDTDRAKLIDVNSTSAVAQTLPRAGVGGAFASGWYAQIRNSGTANITVTPTTSTIDAAASLVIRPGQSVTIRSDGSNYVSTLLQQPANANLWGLAGLSTAADKCVYWTGAGTPALMDCKSWARTVASAADVAAGRAAFGVAIGSDVQAYNANLAAFAGLTGAAGKLPYFTSAAALSLADTTSYGRSVLNTADATALRLLAGLNNVANVDTTTQANVSFTGLTVAAAAADTDTLPVNQGAGNLKQTFAAIKTWIKGWIAKADVGLGNVDNTSDSTKWAATAALTNKTFDCSATGNVCKVRLGSSDVTGTLPKANGGLGAATLSAALDSEFSSAQGAILYRGASGWLSLTPGSAGQFLTTQGAGADPNWSGGGAGTGTVTQVVCNGGATTITASGTCSSREVLAANRSYYVRTDGSDSSCNGSASVAAGTGNCAFLTIQKAINVISSLDIGIYNVSINVADGTYTGANTVNGPWLGSGTVSVVGNTTTPANVVINPTSATCFAVKNGGSLSVSGVELRGNVGLNADNGGSISVGSSVRFGAATAYQVYATGGSIVFSANYSIVGGAISHLVAEAGGRIRGTSLTITLTGTPAFSGQFVAANAPGAAVVYFLNTFSGSATGSRYNAANGGYISVNGAGTSYLPGNASGTGTNFGASPYGLYQ